MHRYSLPLCLAFLLLAGALPSLGEVREAGAREAKALTWPKLLSPGDTVMFVAPAGPPDRDQVMVAKRRIEDRGYRVKMRDDIFDVEGYLAGADERRAEELMQAFADEEVDAVLCVRGGYGSMRILDKLDFDVIRENPKLVTGFSDITALHAALNRKARLVSFHAPGPASGLGTEQGPSDFTARTLIQAVEFSGDSPDDYEIDVPASVAQVEAYGKGRARGRLTGGNLSLVCALEGTPYAVEADGAILLIEDVNEAPYRIDRMLRQLQLAGKLEKLKGVVLGQFTEEYVREDRLTDDKRFDTQGILRQYFENAGVPVLVNFPVGHHKENCTLPLGAEVEVDADARTLRVIREKP